MNFRYKYFSLTLVLVSILFAASCETQTNLTNSNSNSNQVAVNTQPSPAQTSPSPQVNDEEEASNMPVTLPVLDAMFADANFASELKAKLNLTDEQIEKLRQTAREATKNLKESDEAIGSTAESRRKADEQIQAILGADKAKELTRFVRERWKGGESQETASSNKKPNAIPTDTRIVVNAPAYRMDIFKDGQLARSYKIGIGYPEFPLPTGNRKATEIIFNPTWTPPDEPWVEGSDKVKAGQTVEAGSKLNPLGPIKIPIGLPSLIHGGKNPARLGQFASHGCVGLTSPQVEDFSLALAQISNTELTNEDVANYGKNKTETKNVKLSTAIPVELRYETIVVENGKLKIYRDVYERGTNTEENLRRTLEVYGVSLDSLTEQERAKALDALKQMAVGASGNPIGTFSNSNANMNSANTTSKNTNGANKNANTQSGSVTRNTKGKKEIVIDIAALKGKGYPAPVDLNTGGKSNKPLDFTSKSNKENETNSNRNSMNKKS